MAAVIAVLGGASIAHAQDSDYSNDKRVLACTPGTLKKGGAVTLLLGPRHGAELAIQRDGTRDWYFIVTGGPEKPHFMTTEAFAAAKRATLTEKTTGWGPGGKLEQIFTRPGRYVVYISDKLESDGGGNICNINYRP